MTDAQNWHTIVEAIRELGCICRIKAVFDETPSNWDGPMFEPVESHVELASYGPVDKTDVEWIDIDPLVSTYVGKRVPNRQIDVRNELFERFSRSGVEYEDTSGVVRIVIAREG